MTKNTRPSSFAKVLGKGIGQLLRGQWREAASTLQLSAWFGRYVGFSLILVGGLALLLTIASLLVPTPIDWTQSALAIFVFSIILLPLAIWAVYSVFGPGGARFRAVSFRGGCIEGMLLATLFVAVMGALRWIQSLEPNPRQPEIPSPPQAQQSSGLDLLVPETAQRRVNADPIAESLRAHTGFDKSTPGFSSLARGRDLVKSEEYDAAADAFTEALTENPQLWLAFQERGRLLASFGIYDQAVEDFSNVLRLAPGLKSAYKDRAGSCFMLGNLDQTIADCTSALTGSFADHEVYHLRGLARSYQGDHQRAIEDFTAALRLDPKFAQGFCDRAHSLMAIGALSEALADCNRAIRLNPELPQAYHRRGRIHRAMKKWKEALKDFDRAIELDSQFPTAYADRALTRITATDAVTHNPEQAIKDATTACELTNWKDFMAVEILARSYAEAGQAENARQNADLMVQLAPQSHRAVAEKTRTEILNELVK